MYPSLQLRAVSSGECRKRRAFPARTHLPPPPSPPSHQRLPLHRHRLQGSGKGGEERRQASGMETRKQVFSS